MKIIVDDDFADNIVSSAIVETYVSVKEELKRYKKNKKADWHEDDVANWERLLPALEIVGGWFCVDFKKEVKQHEKDSI